LHSGDGLHLSVEGNNILASVVHPALGLEVLNDLVVSPILYLLLD
jgi:hypothetical protein